MKRYKQIRKEEIQGREPQPNSFAGYISADPKDRRKVVDVITRLGYDYHIIQDDENNFEVALTMKDSFEQVVYNLEKIKELNFSAKANSSFEAR